MTGPKSFGEIFRSFTEWLSERFSINLTWLTRSRESIREDLTQRTAQMLNDPDIDRIAKSAVVEHSPRRLGDKLFRGGVTEEYNNRIAGTLSKLESELPADDQANLREIRRLHTAGDFSPQERDDIWNQAVQRAGKNPQRPR